jgi:hypothetical protein
LDCSATEEEEEEEDLHYKTTSMEVLPNFGTYFTSLAGHYKETKYNQLGYNVMKGAEYFVSL